MAAWRLLANSVASYNTRKRRCNTRSQVPTGQVLCLSTCEYLLGHVFAASVAEHLRHRRCGDGVVRLDHCYRVLVEGVAALPSIKRRGTHQTSKSASQSHGHCKVWYACRMARGRVAI